MRVGALIEAVPRRSTATQIESQPGNGMGWAPLILLPLLVFALRLKLLPWVFMWVLAIAIFASCKWATWWEFRAACPLTPSWKRSAAYLLFWPGMDAPEFFAPAGERPQIPVREWLEAIGKILAGMTLIWFAARVMALGHPELGGRAGLLGLVLVLHFGVFSLMALAWQRAGIRVTPIMQRPLESRSLTELWGKRWNLGYRALSYKWVFQPLQRRWGPVAGTLGAFLVSGLVHELVISVPARGGYGLPTAYFLLQGFGSLAERLGIAKRIGLGGGLIGWTWTALIALGPLGALFHPPFMTRVIVPFLRALSNV